MPFYLFTLLSLLQSALVITRFYTGNNKDSIHVPDRDIKLLAEFASLYLNTKATRVCVFNIGFRYWSTKVKSCLKTLRGREATSCLLSSLSLRPSVRPSSRCRRVACKQPATCLCLWSSEGQGKGRARTHTDIVYLVVVVIYLHINKFFFSSFSLSEMLLMWLKATLVFWLSRCCLLLC